MIQFYRVKLKCQDKFAILRMVKGYLSRGDALIAEFEPGVVLLVAELPSPPTATPRRDAAAIDVEGGRKKRLPVKIGFLLLQTGFSFQLFRDRGAGLALDNFCQHVDHRRPVLDDQGVGRFIWYDAAFG